MLARVGADPPLAALDVLAHLAVHGSLHGEHRARVVSVARLAWSGGALLRAPSIDGMAWPLLAAAMLYVGEFDFALEICDAALSQAREQNAPGLFAAASACRAWVLYELGRITEAAADAQAGLEARADGWQRYLRSGYSAMALCHIEMGELERAETALSIVDHPDGGESVHLPSLLEARAQLRLAQRRFQDALDDALAAGEGIARSFGPTGPAALPWRSTAALAQLALGRPAAAQELAAAEMEAALNADLPGLITRNLRILGLAEGGAAGLELLAEAVRRGEQHGPRLEQARTLLEYGAALRRANQRSAAREPLRAALAIAQPGGATVLAQRACDELAASGARKTRLLLSGVESLTPSERRVADIAVRGLTTRQIAESLFVTPKTVEFHLRHIYQKLDIRSRTELAALLDRAGRPPLDPDGPLHPR
jgi:DNA-binding CsgD family transcriptional regulator